jgi:mannose-6-phosphate isomerase-like protein (cupin superfamily)
MLRASDERQDLFGGHGVVRVTDLLGATVCAPFQAVLECELEAGAAVGTHLQADYAEIVIVIEGTGTIAVNDEQRTVVAGDVVALPLGATLAIDNSGQERSLRYLIVKAG